MDDERLEDGQILQVREAAAMLGYHEETLRRMTREGRVPAFRIGRKWHYDRRVLSRWTQERHEEQQRVYETMSGSSRAGHVLVVDDEFEIREVYRRMLAKGAVETASNGAEAIEQLTSNPPALLVLDLVMPGTDGVDVLKRLRQLDPELPVIVSTGYPNEAVMARALEYGPFTLLKKPVSQEQLLSTSRMLTSGNYSKGKQRAGKAEA